MSLPTRAAALSPEQRLDAMQARMLADMGKDTDDKPQKVAVTGTLHGTFAGEITVDELFEAQTANAERIAYEAEERDSQIVAQAVAMRAPVVRNAIKAETATVRKQGRHRAVLVACLAVLAVLVVLIQIVVNSASVQDRFQAPTQTVNNSLFQPPASGG